MEIFGWTKNEAEAVSKKGAVSKVENKIKNNYVNSRNNVNI
jgi:hypothetical protein